MAVSANIGDKVKISGNVKTSAVAVDPSVVKGWTRTPSGTVTTYTYGTDSEVAKVDTGDYTLTFDVDMAGTWWCGFYSTGTGKAASDDVRVNVQSSRRIA